MPTPPVRVRLLNDRPVRPDGHCVLYWMIASRRLTKNFGLAHAADAARELGRPLVILEALRVDYPWASERLHTFVIEGMADHRARLEDEPVTYLPYVEPARGAGRGLLAALAADACLVVTDDFPCFFLPRMVDAAARLLPVPLVAVDSNGLLPIRDTNREFATAFSFRAHVQRTLRAALENQPGDVRWHDLPRPQPIPAAIRDRWPVETADRLSRPADIVATLPIDHTVPPVKMRGGSQSGATALARFVSDALPRYDDDRNQPEQNGTSRLSPYLHFGHLGAHDVFDAVMTAERWTTRRLGTRAGGVREGWWGVSPGAEGFLDQLVTWRELGYNFCATRPADYWHYSALPAWARTTLERHRGDRREWQYDRETLERAETHDDIWNAAQRQLVRDGWMHNYLRMLWGKKIVEWSATPEDALDAMIAIMNRHAVDGRNPNSYTGYAWVLGRYDRPWGPERPIFGTVRYMSSDNTRRKLRLKQFLKDYGPRTPDDRLF